MSKVDYRKLYCEYHGLKEIPKGYHVHHRNKNRNDNTKENLILLSAHKHLSMHMKHRRKINKAGIFMSDREISKRYL